MGSAQSGCGGGKQKSDAPPPGKPKGIIARAFRPRPKRTSYLQTTPTTLVQVKPSQDNPSSPSSKQPQVHSIFPVSSVPFTAAVPFTVSPQRSARRSGTLLPLREAFEKHKGTGRPTFVGFVTAGFPTREATVPLMLGLQDGGADVIELGIPFTDPSADGPAIQRTVRVALAHDPPVSLAECIAFVKTARSQGLRVPVVLMGYLNPLLAYGQTALMVDFAAAGGDGFIVVDLPPEEGASFIAECRANKLAFVPLVTPATTNERIASLATVADGFLYCVSLTGVTGARSNLPPELPQFIKRVRDNSNVPLAVGFGVSTADHVAEIAGFADGVVVGSAICRAVDEVKQTSEIRTHIAAFVKTLLPDKKQVAISKRARGDTTNAEGAAAQKKAKIDTSVRLVAHFGDFGGRYIPETLVEAHRELEEAYDKCKEDPTFIAEIAEMRARYVGGPTPMYHAKRLTAEMGGAQIWLKREELAHTGAHKINNAIGQALIAMRLGKKRIIAETGAGQHGVATATICALLGLECVVYMGAEDVRRQSLNVFRMKVLGATVHPVDSGAKTLKDAINEAMRDWVTNVSTSYYLIGSASGPHPYPTLVRDFQTIIGIESREQILRDTGRLPDYIVACVGGGSNAIGMFHPFINDKDVKLIGVEAGGHGIETGRHAAPLSGGFPGVLHGTRTYLLQNSEGQIQPTHSISAGLDYPGVGPEHSFLKDSGRAQYVAVTDSQALEGFKTLCRTEGIIPALEPSHALYHAMQLAKGLSPDAIVLMNLCGRGDKDLDTVAQALGITLRDTELSSRITGGVEGASRRDSRVSQSYQPAHRKSYYERVVTPSTPRRSLPSTRAGTRVGTPPSTRAGTPPSRNPRTSSLRVPGNLTPPIGKRVSRASATINAIAQAMRNSRASQIIRVPDSPPKHGAANSNESSFAREITPVRHFKNDSSAASFGPNSLEPTN
mmetsp:Transcript_20423/g.47875  ORF Transcript_20423/g.47875 Transcript_20423/m.47875 type:complete len:951 (+) Transcript_20423:58-2910(+)